MGCWVLLGTFRFKVSWNKFSSIFIRLVSVGLFSRSTCIITCVLIIKGAKDFQGDWLEEGKMGVGEGMCSTWGNRVIHDKLWLENLKGKDKRETPRICALHIRETGVFFKTPLFLPSVHIGLPVHVWSCRYKYIVYRDLTWWVVFQQTLSTLYCLCVNLLWESVCQISWFVAFEFFGPRSSIMMGISWFVCWRSFSLWAIAIISWQGCTCLQWPFHEAAQIILGLH
jgi:hypothetical protein